VSPAVGRLILQYTKQQTTDPNITTAPALSYYYFPSSSLATLALSLASSNLRVNSGLAVFPPFIASCTAFQASAQSCMAWLHVDLCWVEAWRFARILSRTMSRLTVLTKEAVKRMTKVRKGFSGGWVSWEGGWGLGKQGVEELCRR
jgi:hypothetical protein